MAICVVQGCKLVANRGATGTSSVDESGKMVVCFVLQPQ